MLAVVLSCDVLSCFSCVWHFMTLWMVAHQAPLFMGFSSQECCSPPGDLPDPGTEPTSPSLLHCRQIYLHTEPPGKPIILSYMDLIMLNFVPSISTMLRVIFDNKLMLNFVKTFCASIEIIIIQCLNVVYHIYWCENIETSLNFGNKSQITLGLSY